MRRSPPNPAGPLWALGAATLVVAARWREINLHGGEIPTLDQWVVEARQILLPWLEGKLTLADFFRPHHEHVPAWTRFVVWLEAVIFRQWDAQLQATVNAGLMGGFIGLLAGWLRRTLPLLPALGLTLLAVVTASLPHSWENIVWGFQSHMALAVLFVFAYVKGSLARPPNTWGWWLAQAAGLAALFTLGSMWAAPLAVVLVLLWTTDFNWKTLLAAGLMTLVGVTLLIVARSQQPLTGAYAMGAANFPQFLAALLMQLGWPSEWPGAALLLYLPALLLALRLRGNRAAGAIDRIALALALWAAAQAVAFAYARGSYIGFVSRYGDLLALGVLANGVALWRLFQASRSGSRLVLILLAVGWFGAVGLGLENINIQGHTLYFHEHEARWNLVRKAAVSQYVANQDRSVLEGTESRAVLFPDPDEVAQALDHPELAAMLPFVVRAGSAKTFGDFFSDASRDLRGNWLEFAWCGGLLLLLGIALTRRDGPAPEPETAALPGAVRSIAVVFAGLALGSGALLFLWSHPFEYRTMYRWKQFLTPAGTVEDFKFLIVTETTFPKDQLTGGAALWPENFRNTFFGTHIDGPAFTGTAQSSAFPLNAPWYLVPYAGYPISAGNALRLRIEDAAGKLIEEIPCPGPNPGPGATDIGFWAIDVQPYSGKIGRLVLVDGRDDGEGWVAVASPFPTQDGEKVAAHHRRRWAAEGTLSGLHSLQAMTVAFLLFALGSGVLPRISTRLRAGEIQR